MTDLIYRWSLEQTGPGEWEVYDEENDDEYIGIVYRDLEDGEYRWSIRGEGPGMPESIQSVCGIGSFDDALLELWETYKGWKPGEHH